MWVGSSTWTEQRSLWDTLIWILDGANVYAGKIYNLQIEWFSTEFQLSLLLANSLSFWNIQRRYCCQLPGWSFKKSRPELSFLSRNPTLIFIYSKIFFCSVHRAKICLTRKFIRVALKKELRIFPLHPPRFQAPFLRFGRYFQPPKQIHWKETLW